MSVHLSAPSSSIGSMELDSPASRYFRRYRQRYAAHVPIDTSTKWSGVSNPQTMNPRASQVAWCDHRLRRSAALLMSDDQWRRAIMKYRTEHRTFRQSDFLKGGAHELSQVLGERTKEDPDRFARLCLTFPVDANSLYLERTLDALRDATVDGELKLMVCRKAYADSRKQCGKSIADVLGSIEDPLPEDTVEMLQWLATEHDDPEKELWNEVVENGLPYYNGDIHMNGINTTRGRAAQAIQQLILTDATYIERLRPAIDRMITDRSAAVRSCVAGVLQAVGYHDPPIGMCLFLSMDLSEDRLLATRLVEGFIRNQLRDEFPKLRSIIERMLRSTESVVRSAGGRLASISAMIHQSAGDLGDEALHGNRSQRVGAAQVAAGNIGVPQFRLWCETRLLTLFNDDDHTMYANKPRSASAVFPPIALRPMPILSRVSVTARHLREVRFRLFTRLRSHAGASQA